MKTPLKVFDVITPGPTGDGYQEMVDRLTDLCGDWEDPRVVLAMGLEEHRREFAVAMKEARIDEKVPIFEFQSDEYTWKRSHTEHTARVWKDGEWKEHTVPAKELSTTSERPHSLASRITAEQIVTLHYKGRKDELGKWELKPKELAAVVSLYQNPENRERYLDVVSKLPIEVYFVGLFDADGNQPDSMTQRGVTAETLFRSYDDLEALPELEERILDICSDEEITAVGALPGHRKTFTLLQVVKSLLTGAPLFGHFEVKSKAERIIYLTPESAARPFYKRLKLLGLDEFIKNETLLIRDLQMGPISLDDPKLLEVVKGADVFLDTLVRFSDGDENDASDMRLLSEKLFALQKAGARSIWFSHHSVKASSGNTDLSLENAMRGSGDLGAMIANCYALRQIDRQRGTVYVQCVKRRDGQEVLPFIVEGLELRMIKKPGEAGSISDYVGKPGPKIDPGKEEKLQMILDLTDQGKTREEIAEQLGVSVTTVKRWKKEAETEAGRPRY
jgi:hypothetical protein